MIRDHRPPFSSLTLAERIAVLSELRLPDWRVALIVTAAVTVPFGVMARLHSPSMNQFAANYAPLIGEFLLASGVLLVDVVALLFALSFVLEPLRSRATTYCWLAVGVVVSNICLWLTGYWERTATDHSIPYSFAPAVRVMSLAALVPAVPAQVIHWVRRRRGDHRDLLAQNEQNTAAT